MDFGYAQFTEGPILREYIKTEAHKLEDFVGGLLGAGVHTRNGRSLPPQVTGAGANWRREGIFYQRNEVRMRRARAVPCPPAQQTAACRVYQRNERRPSPCRAEPPHPVPAGHAATVKDGLASRGSGEPGRS